MVFTDVTYIFVLIVITFVIVGIIALTIVFYAYNKKYKKFVLNNSGALKQLNEINKTY